MYPIVVLLRILISHVYARIIRFLFQNHCAIILIQMARGVMSCPLHCRMGGSLPYTADLLALAGCGLLRYPSPAILHGGHTPLRHSAWAKALEAHPDRAYVRYILAGISEGFRIGFRRDMTLRSAPRNMFSALEHPDVVQAYLDIECARGHMLGPFSPADRPSLPPCQVNRFGVIPKGRNTGK